MENSAAYRNPYAAPLSSPRVITPRQNSRYSYMTPYSTHVARNSFHIRKDASTSQNAANIYRTRCNICISVTMSNLLIVYSWCHTHISRYTSTPCLGLAEYLLRLFTTQCIGLLPYAISQRPIV